jgi:hypothetical protein
VHADRNWKRHRKSLQEFKEAGQVDHRAEQDQE